MPEKMPIEKKKCITPEFRVSFPHVFEKHSGFKGQEPQYSLTMLFSKTTDLKALKQAAFNAAVEAWGPKEDWPEKYRWPFRDGDKEPKKQGKSEFKNVIFCTASAKKTRPQVINNKKIDGQFQQITKENGGEDIFYAGCYARAELLAFAYDTAGNVGVSFSLQNIQKLRDGAQLSGRKNAEDVFDEVEEASEDPANYDHISGVADTSDMGF